MPITGEHRKCRACKNMFLPEELLDKPAQGGKGICFACVEAYASAMHILTMDATLSLKVLRHGARNLSERYGYDQA